MPAQDRCGGTYGATWVGVTSRVMKMKCGFRSEAGGEFAIPSSLADTSLEDDTGKHVRRWHSFDAEVREFGELDRLRIRVPHLVKSLGGGRHALKRFETLG